METRIIFIEDIEELMKDQIVSFSNAISERISSDDELSMSDLNEIGLTIKDGTNTISITCEKVQFSLENGELPQAILKRLEEIVEKYKGYRCLFVVDLCLDNDESMTGAKVGEALEKSDNYKVLYTSGTSKYWQLNKGNNNFIRRASHGSQMDDSFAASRRNALFFECQNRYGDSIGIYKLMLSLLEAAYINEQYFGVVLYRAMEMIEK